MENGLENCKTEFVDKEKEIKPKTKLEMWIKTSLLFVLHAAVGSILDAASNGASNAVPIVLGIISNIIAFVAFVAFLNAVVNWFGTLVGVNDIDFEWIFSKIFIPLAWSMGVPWEDCDAVAKVVATKSIINEFVAYEKLGVLIASKAITVSCFFLSKIYSKSPMATNKCLRCNFFASV